MVLKMQVSLMIFTLAVSTIGICVWHWRKRQKVYVKVGSIKKLYFYPVKSLKGIEVNEAKCGSRGIECFGVKNRYYMLVSGEGVMVSQREEPSLVLLTPEICGDKLIIHSSTSDPLQITLADTVSLDEKVADSKIHTDQVKTVDCGDEAAKWFQHYLKRNDVRLVRCSSDLPNREYKSNKPFIAKIKQDYPVNLEDFAAFHVVSQSSLDELNAKLETKVSVLNFRPNILIEGAPAFDEDNWKYIKFSSGAEIFVMLPCGRCVLTTNDPETAIKTNKEPLTTLRKFRMPKDPKLAQTLSHAPCFGVNCWLHTPGNIRIGDDVFVVVQKGLFKF